ncbi:uncharacterized protein RJT21DRAFT_133700 [Scheffersomyces amazonensis]|uniref:uncharacterized protein n=1 Tax=Scheffersomyces amazonensis TaxID=1078765 RepID=UPI00315C7E9B
MLSPNCELYALIYQLSSRLTQPRTVKACTKPHLERIKLRSSIKFHHVFTNEKVEIYDEEVYIPSILKNYYSEKASKSVEVQKPRKERRKYQKNDSNQLRRGRGRPRKHHINDPQFNGSPIKYSFPESTSSERHIRLRKSARLHYNSQRINEGARDEKKEDEYEDDKNLIIISDSDESISVVPKKIKRSFILITSSSDAYNEKDEGSDD